MFSVVFVAVVLKSFAPTWILCLQQFFGAEGHILLGKMACLLQGVLSKTSQAEMRK